MTAFRNQRMGGLGLEAYWLRLFSSQTFSRINTPTFSNPVILHTYPPMKMEQSVPKRRHIKFRRRGITQKKPYNIQNTAKVWNQGCLFIFSTCFGWLYWPSSGDTTVSMRHLALVTLYGWLSGLQAGMNSFILPYLPDSHIVAHSLPKHVEKINKRTKKNCAPSWLYLQN
jgi:hypothetical protein